MERKFLYLFLICIAAILPVSTLTLNPADFKILSFLLFVPFILYKPLFDNFKTNLTINKSIAHFVLVLFILYCIYISTNWFFKSYPYYGNRGFIYHWVCISGFLLGVFYLRDKSIINVFILTLSIVLAIASVYALGEYFGYIPPLAVNKYPVEITGLVGHKNTFGFLIMASLPWNVYYISSNKKNPQWQINLILVNSFIQFIALTLSDSRGSLVLTILGITLVFIPILFKRNIPSSFRSRLGIYGIILILGLLPLLFWNENTWIRIAGLFSNIHNNLSARPVLYQAQWKMFLKNPVFGCGVGNFVYLNIPFWTDSFRKISDPFTLPLNGHCDYLETLCELGIVGFFLTLFFWIGAIVNSLRDIQRQKNFTVYTHLVVLLLMMIHAGFSTASRHIPSGILLWTTIGLMWAPTFKTGWLSVSAKWKIYISICYLTIHIIVIGLLMQIMIGDALYLSFRKNKERIKKPVSLLQKSLKVCPFNPNALFQTCYLSLRAKEYDFALHCVDQLDSTAPNLKPTYFLRGVISMHTGNYSDACHYAENALYRNPIYFDAKVLKAKALSKLGSCTELQKIQKQLSTTNMPKDTGSQAKPVTPNYDSLFTAQTGRLRTIIGGPFLRKSFDQMQRYYNHTREENKKKRNGILSLPCSPQIKKED